MPKPSRFTIILVRSCETEWDAVDRLCGVTDLPPTDESIRSLTLAVDQRTEIVDFRSKMDLILSGPSEASSKTASILSGATETKIRVIDELHELNFGLWEGVQRSALEERIPTVFSQWIAQPGTVAPPDGESLETVQDRILVNLFKGLKKLKTEHPVVGLVLRPYAWAVVKCWLDQRPLSDVWSYIDADSTVEAFSLDRTSLEVSRTPKPQIA